MQANLDKGDTYVRREEVISELIDDSRTYQGRTYFGLTPLNCLCLRRHQTQNVLNDAIINDWLFTGSN